MFDKPAVRTLRDQIQAALDELGEQLDVEIKLGSATFTSDNITFKMEVASLNDDGEAISRMVTDFQRMAGIYGLNQDDLNREFTMRGNTYKLVGAVPRRSKYPLVCEANGKRFKFAPETVKMCLQIQKQSAVMKVREGLNNPCINTTKNKTDSTQHKE
jgi:hypothetical protein